MTTGSPRVAIVVVNYNGGPFIDEFASSLAAVDYEAPDLYLIDNASTDGSQHRLSTLFPEARLFLNDTNCGLAPALNQALVPILEGDYAYVLFLNPDTALEPNFLRLLVSIADEHTLVVPKVLAYHDRTLINTEAGGFDWTRGLFVNTYDGRPDGPAISQRRELETASFCCMLIPVRAFKLLGPLDERFAMYYEDTDFVAHARASGFRLVFEPSARVYHREGGSSGGKESPFKHYYATRNRPYLVKKHVGRARYVAFTAYYLATRLAKSLACLCARDWPLLRAQLRAVRDYYTGRMGMTYQPKDLA